MHHFIHTLHKSTLTELVPLEPLGSPQEFKITLGFELGLVAHHESVMADSWPLRIKGLININLHTYLFLLFVKRQNCS